MAYKWKDEQRQRRDLANNPSVHPDKRSYFGQLNERVTWGATTTTTSTTTT